MKNFLISLSVLFTLSSCKTRIAEPSGFLQDPYRLEDGKFLQKVWRSKTFNLADYDKITVVPVTTTFLRNMGWWQKFNSSTYRDSDIFPEFKADANRPAGRQLAKYFEDQMILQFKNAEGTKLKYVPFGQADSKTLIIKIAIIELVPVKKFMVGLGLIADGSLKGGSIAIEGHFKNARTHELLAMFSDRKVNNRPSASSEIPSLSWYSHAKPIMKAWAKTFVSIVRMNQQKNK